MLTEQLNSRVVTDGQRRLPAAEPAVPGAAGTDIWTFRADGPGKAKITLGYMKQSVTPSEKADEVTYTVEVK